jgi:hypothetical protein
VKVRVNIRLPLPLREATRADEAVVLGPSEHPPADPVLYLEALLVRCDQTLQLVGHIIRELLRDVDVVVGLVVLACGLHLLDD